MNKFDVAIIGSGPAGAMAAKQIASEGFSVILIERKKQIGKPVQCGEAITKFALDHVNIPIQSKWIKQKVKGVKILLPDDKSFYSTVPGFTIDRHQFDLWLTNQAIKEGAHLALQTTMKNISKSANNQWIIKTTNNKYQSRMLIGADGAESKTAQLIGLLTKKMYIKAFQYTFNKNDINFPILDWLCMKMDAQFRGGYGWIFPRKDEYNVGVGSIHGSMEMLSELCNQFNFDPDKKINITGGLVPYQFEMPSRVTKNVLIIGDAAGLTNPVTGGGIHPALYSGKVAGKLLCNALQYKDNSYLYQYDSIMNKSLFVHPIHYKTSQYFHQWTNEDWKFLGNAANGLDMSDLSLLKCLGIGLKYPRYLLRAKELLTIRKDMKINQKYGW